MKYFLAGTLAALILLSLVAWRIQPRETDAGRVTLVWSSDDNPARREQIELFNRTHPRYKLVLDPSAESLEKVIVQCIGGVGPDIIDWGRGDDLIKAGVVLDLTEQLKKIGVNYEKDTWEFSRRCSSYGGRIYGFPTNAASNALWYNKDIFDHAGIPYPKGPWKWEQFIPLAQRLMVRDKNGRVTQYGFLSDWDLWTQFAWQWGGRMFTKDGTRCIIDSPQAVAGLQFVHDLIYKYRVMPTPAEQKTMATQGGWGTGNITLFGGGKGAMAMGGRWWLCLLRQYEHLRMGAVESPYDHYRVNVGGSRCSFINKNSPHRQGALEFIKFLDSEQYNELINHQADAVAPVPRYCYTKEYLHDPAYPNEDSNAVWRDTMTYSRIDEISPFVSPLVVLRILTKQTDLVLNNQKSPAEALKTGALQVNAEIRNSIQRDPSLRREYERLTREKAK